ncbi:ankyrin repeat domain-containing protein [Candidatus Berkiella cookevillensis]|uniref:Ankyrin repeat domain-containing protein n=1 Tax=Candidatus Berkiella cookevillensis TaxID=437022 RepID=A0A0Q9YV27_9GAMM|nr:ankyrin repeat domain-containing protein [Candidatus Berkiella cookevillensis]MCS5708507.1 ankyrin repeat domain-containing protein [Candidatus Berkiella cookevillensis]
MLGKITSIEFKEFLSAIKKGNLYKVKQQLENNALKNKIASKNNKALCTAIQNEHIHIIEYLLTFGGVKNAVGGSGNYALCLAIEKGNLGIIEFLLEFDGVKNNVAINDNILLMTAVLHGRLDVVNCLLKFPEVTKNITAGNNRALQTAYKFRYDAIVKRLMEFDEVRAVVAALPPQKERIKSYVLAACKKEPSSKDLWGAVIAAMSLNSLKSYLETSLAAQGLSLKMRDGDELNSPLLNTHHQVYRYLFGDPNFWMSPGANFVKNTAQGRRSSITEKDLHLLGHIWRAICEGHINYNEACVALMQKNQLAKNGGNNSLKENFLLNLVVLARKHNFNNGIDDGGLDKPGCSMLVQEHLLVCLSGLKIIKNECTSFIGEVFLGGNLYAKDILQFVEPEISPKIDIDVAMHESRVLQFSQTESSNARNPKPLAEPFGDMQLDSNESKHLNIHFSKP